MWRGRLSLRKVWDIIRNLPPGSAFSRRVDPEQWRAEHYLLADTYDLLVVGHGLVDKDNKQPLPPHERPGDRAVKERKQAEMDRKILASTERFRRQQAAGGDFDE